MDCDDMDCDDMNCDDMDCDAVDPPYLPIHIIEEIIVRLPVKSLLQIRCVCKSWQALISDPIFVKRHLRRASTKEKEDDDYEQKSLLVMPDFAHFNLKSCSLSSVLYEETLSTRVLDYPLKNPRRSIRIVGSVNGLVCIVIDNKVLVLWNPSTGKSRRLPNCGFKKSPVRVYGLKSDSWKKIGDFPGRPMQNVSSMFVSGSLHWISVTGLFMRSVISLDLSKETYSTIVEPSYGEGYGEGDGDVMVSILGVLSGNLCMLSYMDAEYADLWVMKEYGKVESCKILDHHISAQISSNSLDAPTQLDVTEPRASIGSTNGMD
ncbi:F-box/kelch-repeat protein At3g23880-like [Impatiens glandulifera]|uniref:F-box/kelch-repeat protein At3g23880-like n=1 Tax=Impatiens glandulifera TaxID=253017 RepID=UPI001FB04F15|nr:F-box/kelch-repeat protein At3g23880-like [Impatiens glandulifera]